MKDRKILFTDVDGTLLNSNREISGENREAIDKALAMGHKVVINTGRSQASAIKQAEKIGLVTEGCFIISYNGGDIYDCGRGESVFHARIPLEQVFYLFGQAREWGLHCQTYQAEAVISEKVTKELLRYCEACEVPYVEVKDLAQFLTEEPAKVLAIDYNGRERLMKFREQLSEWTRDKLECAFSSAYMLEFMPQGVSKGAAVKRLCQHLGIPIENTVAAGDGENDITMLKAAHIGAVMRNGDDAVKAWGNYITENDNDHSGVAEIIHKFIL